ncbi:nesprin-4 [Eublepharis macularius]|uniref:Nesprin-4 n=1 Tax=Eublepharis macularius TaxID=481883 RepID=A0AA97LHN4_EUBMA|nr:nesprin-4 [Eublepharis macularius]
MQKAVLSSNVPLGQQDNGINRGLAGWCGELVPEAAICSLCTVSVEKRIRAEQAWRQQTAFQDSLFRFQDWLWAAEVTAASANSSQVSYAHSKKELQRFEILQKQVQEKLMPLEDLNRQYRLLVRSGGIGLHLRSVVQEISQRWDDLQRRVAAIYKRLKYFVNQREEFESERETIRVWLTELDLRLTDVEHFSGGTSLDKMIQLQTFQQDVQSIAERVDLLLVRGECLIQKSQPEDAEVLEEELQDLSGFCQDVFRRVFRFRRRLVSMRLVFENEWWSDRESDLESDSFTEGSLDLEIGSPSPASGRMCHSTPKKSPHQFKYLALGPSMDLEWDPSVDVGGSTSHDEEDSSYYSAITGVGQWEEPSRRCPSSRQMSHLRCGSQEDSLVPSGCKEDREPFSCSLTDEIPKEIQTNSFSKTSLWHLEKRQQEQPQSCLPGKGTSRQIEPMGFDPKRIESWLGQAHQEKLERQLETEPDAGTFGAISLSITELHLPVQSKTNDQQAKRQKSLQRMKKKVRATSIPQAGQTCKRKQLDSYSGEIAVTIEKGYDPPQPLGLSTQPQKLPRIPTLLNRLLLSTIGLLLLLLLASACILSLADPSCHCTNGYTRSFHLVLKYINGPPPT